MGVEVGEFYVECDHCYRSADPCESEREAVRQAEQKGFREIKGLWLCLECQDDVLPEWQRILVDRYALAGWELDAMIDRDERTVAWLITQRPRLKDCLEELEALRGTVE